MDPLLEKVVLSVFGIAVTAIIGWLIAERKKAGEDREKLRGRVEELETKAAVVDSQILPYNAVMQSLLVKQLTHFHTPKMDALMVKLGDVIKDTPRTITEKEEKELIIATKQRMQDMGPEIDDDERDAAEALPIFMRRTKREAKDIADGKPFTSVKVVGVISGNPEEAETVTVGKKG